jgi:hypothetical protein
MQVVSVKRPRLFHADLCSESRPAGVGRASSVDIEAAAIFQLPANVVLTNQKIVITSNPVLIAPHHVCHAAEGEQS